MTPSLSKTLKSRWFTGCVHAGMWVLLYLAVTNLGGKAFDYREADGTAMASQTPVPTARLDALFSAGGWPRFPAETNSMDPFFTRHFMPQQLAPPTTRKIELTYQGYYQTADGPLHVVYKLGDAFISGAVGTKITGNLYIAEATMQMLTLTNAASQTNVLPLNVKRELEVPIQ
jgi:hypothetical protein